MSKHKAKRKLQTHQVIRLIQYRINLVRLWINEQKADMPDIIDEIKNKR